jgi:predicted PurR-regulated permease PerM
MAERPSELARTTLSVLFILALIAGSLWVLLPFIAAFVWAATIVIATWPLMLRVERRFGGRRGPAVLVMTLALLAIFILPIGLAAHAMITGVEDVESIAGLLSGLTVPAAPGWVASLPLVGPKAAASWNEIASAGPEGLVERFQPYLRDFGSWFAAHAGTVASLLVQFLITTVFAAVLYSGGEAWATWVRGFARRLAGERGDRIAVLAAQAIRGVALGVVVTALLQTALGGIGVMVAGVPFAAVLTAMMFLLCIAQLGPLLVLIAATVWVWMHSGAVAGTIMLLYALVVGLMDNFVRPVLIKRGADLPLLLIFTGVVGGLVSLGLIGIFVGPVLLAVTYTLLNDWVEPAGSPRAPEQA